MKFKGRVQSTTIDQCHYLVVKKNIGVCKGKQLQKLMLIRYLFDYGLMVYEWVDGYVPCVIWKSENSP